MHKASSKRPQIRYFSYLVQFKLTINKHKPTQDLTGNTDSACSRRTTGLTHLGHSYWHCFQMCAQIGGYWGNIEDMRACCKLSSCPQGLLLQGAFEGTVKQEEQCDHEVKELWLGYGLQISRDSISLLIFFYSALLQNPWKHPTEGGTLVKQHYLKKQIKKDFWSFSYFFSFPLQLRTFLWSRKIHF